MLLPVFALGLLACVVVYSIKESHRRVRAMLRDSIRPNRKGGVA